MLKPRRVDIPVLVMGIVGLMDESRVMGWEPVPTEKIDQAWEEMAVEILNRRLPNRLGQIFRCSRKGVRESYLSGPFSRERFEKLYLESLARARDREKRRKG